jgi:hypothetical protein
MIELHPDDWALNTTDVGGQPSRRVYHRHRRARAYSDLFTAINGKCRICAAEVPIALRILCAFHGMDTDAV